jgi:rhodanese-related sulfurtransferase
MTNSRSYGTYSQVELAPWDGLDSTDAFLLDVREPNEVMAGSISGFVNIPLGRLRAKNAGA